MKFRIQDYKNKERKLQYAALIIFSIVVAFILLEEIIDAFHLDIRLLEDQLYYQTGDLEVFRSSSNPNKIFELNPLSQHVYSSGIHPLENKYDKRRVSINSLGFRDMERSEIKSEGIYRIIIIGGSNTYGAAVSDEDTYPKLLQTKMDGLSSQKVEVWNAGVSAYVPSQKVALAYEIIPKYNPDLLIIQDHNSGRRAFLYGMDATGYFDKNEELFLENIPFLCTDSDLLIKIHEQLVLRYGAYRAAIILLNKILLSTEACEGIIEKYNEYAQKINIREYENFIKATPDLDILFLNPNDEEFCHKKEKTYANIYCFSLQFDANPAEFHEIHPPSYVYEWYAEELKKIIMERYLEKIPLANK